MGGLTNRAVDAKLTKDGRGQRQSLLHWPDDRTAEPAMVDGTLFRTARDLFAEHPEAAHDMLAAPDDRSSVEFCRALLNGRTPEEAVTFCAYLLPARTAVWWAHECLSNIGELIDEGDRTLLELVRTWVSDPQDMSVRATLNEALAEDRKTPAAWVANAAAGAPSPARSINSGILAGLARVSLEDRRAVLADFVEMGLALAETETLQQA